MKPVAIFRHSPTEGPGYFAIFLERQGIPWNLIAIDEGDPVPLSANDFSGLCFMGGPMSVNDPLPWIEPVCHLIRDAVSQDIPVIGHCLGGQLMSKSLGGTVSRNPVKEIGWSEIYAENDPITHRWLESFAGQVSRVFQWHGETFSLPNGATRLFSNGHCTNQMFVLGPHLGMQCHVEMTPEMISTWCAQWAEEASAVSHQPSVQSPEKMLADMQDHLTTMRQLSEQLYRVWIQGLKP